MGIISFIKKSPERDAKSNLLFQEKQIRFALKDCCKQMSHIKIAIDQKPEYFKSSIQKINPSLKKGWVLIDSLFPSYGNDMIQRSKEIDIYFNLKKIRYNFKSSFIKKEKGEVQSIKISYPTQMIYYKEKNGFYIEPSFKKPIPLAFLINSEKSSMVYENIYKIGPKSLLFLTDLGKDILKIGMRIDEINFTISEDITIRTPAVIGQVTESKMKNSPRYICELEFKELEEEKKEKIYEYLFARNREILRNDFDYD